MNFKRNFLLINALVGTVFLVAGCANENDFIKYQPIEEIEDKHEDIIGQDESYLKLGDYKNYTAKNSSKSDVDLGNATKVMRDYSGKKFFDTTGDQKLLVIPVDFQDYTCEKLAISSNEYFNNLNKAFFGNSNNNSYVSVGQYYNVSSYGKLRLDGKVVENFYRFPKSVAEIKSGLDRSIIESYYEQILNWYVDTLGNDDLDDFVVEGLLEPDKTPIQSKAIPIYLVYTYPIELNENNENSSNESNFFWAYSFPNTPISWSSYSFLYTKQGKPDAHTYIHETGHLLGLNDYYPTIEGGEELTPDPTARIDMMDCSIGDHTGFSKMFLNWTRPYYVKKTCEITIRPFTESGDLILLTNSWNQTVFDEYYLIEFYTPTGLNAYDSYVGNSEAKLPLIPGIKIYHVDARLAYFETTRLKKFVGYCNSGAASPTKNNVDFAHDNNTYTTPISENQNYYLYELILNHTDKKISACALDGHLYHEGDEFSSLKLHKTQTPLDFTIKITDVNFRSAKISIEKKM